jgi:hypothetical protein
LIAVTAQDAAYLEDIDLIFGSATKLHFGNLNLVLLRGFRLGAIEKFQRSELLGLPKVVLSCCKADELHQPPFRPRLCASYSAGCAGAVR